MRNTLIIAFFRTLESKFQYAILHHVEDIFSVNNDIDLIVDCSKTELKEFISFFCTENDGYFLSHTIDSGTSRFNLIFLNDNQSFKIELDITFSNHNLLDVNVKKLLKKKTKLEVKGFLFTKIENNDEIEYYLGKKAFKKESIDKNLGYFKNLNSTTDFNELKFLFDTKSSKFESFSFSCRKKLQKLYLFFIRMYEKPSLTICFLGPDGSGKSTIIEALKNQNPFVNFKYFHLKPTIKKKSSTIIINPHSDPAYPIFVSYLKLIYLIFQYNINWILNIWTIKLTPAIIIFDRYFDDIIADPKRYRYGGSLKVVKIARMFIPKPAITFVLVAKSEIIHSRKKEVSKKELDSQLERYTNLCLDYKFKKIEVSNSIPEIVNEVIREILNKKKHAV